MKRLIVYDLDGTLVDTLDDIHAAANHMLEVLGQPGVSRSDVRRFIGRGLHDLVACCLGTQDPVRVGQGVASFRAYYGQHLTDRSRLYPRTRDVLDYFAARQQAVITNKPNPFSRDLLLALGIGHYFLDVLAGDSGYPRKPDPHALRALMERTRVGADGVLLIGDSPIDVQMGRQASVFAVGVSHGFTDESELRASAPDALVRDFAELLEFAQRSGW